MMINPAHNPITSCNPSIFCAQVPIYKTSQTELTFPFIFSTTFVTLSRSLIFVNEESGGTERVLERDGAMRSRMTSDRINAF